TLRLLTPTLFPYTTLFRSEVRHTIAKLLERVHFHEPAFVAPTILSGRGNKRFVRTLLFQAVQHACLGRDDDRPGRRPFAEFHHRSEEHTSELQSLAYLVCR